MSWRIHWLLATAAAIVLCCLFLYGGEKGPVIPQPDDGHVITMPFPLQRLQQLAAQTNQVLRANNYWLPR